MKVGQNQSVWRDEKGRVVAINLGADDYYEHEQGIKAINIMFHINPPDFRIKSFPLHENGETMLRANLKGFTLSGNKIYGIALFSTPTKETFHKSFIKYHMKDSILFGAWDEARFTFLSTDKKLVSDIWEAFNKLDVSMCIEKTNGERNGGLIIAITSRVLDVVKNMPSNLGKQDDILNFIRNNEII
jgi:hypothetical protein